MTTLKVGIAEQGMKVRLHENGQLADVSGGPKVWFTSTESFAKILSHGNRELLRVIVERRPQSLDELARLTGKAKSNLSRTLKTMASYGLITRERGERGRLTPTVAYDEVQLTIPLSLPCTAEAVVPTARAALDRALS